MSDKFIRFSQAAKYFYRREQLFVLTKPMRSKHSSECPG
jgi:hypothetical protein